MIFPRSLYVCLLFGIIFSGCIKDDTVALNENILSEYIERNNDRELADLIACAGGKEGGLTGDSEFNTSVFFYPIIGAQDFQYYEALDVADSLNFDKYIRKELPSEPIFNGYLWKFKNNVTSNDVMGIVTYKTPGKLHVCTPIRIKTNTKPTEVDASTLSVAENGMNPMFTWQDGSIEENVIYFHVISDQQNNLISGTYTIEQNFTFYDLSNVVLNITDDTSDPILETNSTYNFTLMGVSEDNWVNLFVETSFETN